MRALWSTLLCAAAATAPPACGDNDEPHTPPPRTVAPSPTEGVDSAALGAMLVEHWDIDVARDPFWGTWIGDHRVDRELPPVALADVTALKARRRALLAHLTALDPGTLSPRDRLTHAIFLERLTEDVGLEVCNYERWAISRRGSFVGHLDNIGEYHPLLDADDADSYRTRVAAMPDAVDRFGAELVAGAAAGLTSDRQALIEIIFALGMWADRTPGDWPMVNAIRNGYLAAGERDRLIADVTAIIARQLAPAYRRLATTLETSVRPAEREIAGLAGLPLGADCYAAEIRRHTTLPITAADLHALGLAEVARVEAEMIALGRQLYGVDTLPAIVARLDNDPSLRFRSEPEILDWVEGIIDHARERVTPLFATFPVAPLVVTPYPAYFGQVAASYRVSPDGVQPAHYYLVTQPPDQQTRWDLEATTYHEAIPGHHLQTGRAAELTDLPALRRVRFDTGFVEGWGLYAETLAGEIDLYTSAPARLGRLANEALRACRLVIDTGLHDLGWTRTEAISYMEQHSLYGGAYVVNEIERYVAGPGQALAYKVGELELLRLRAEVQARDGAAFSLRGFHEAVIAEGSLPLAILGDRLLGPGATQRVRLGDPRNRNTIAHDVARVAAPVDAPRLPAPRPHGDTPWSPTGAMPSPMLPVAPIELPRSDHRSQTEL
jgi:uncharacterized protein (DUF885 family)